MSDHFRELREHELSQLTDEQLIAYIVRARDLGRTETMTVALRVLAWGYWHIIELRVALKVPTEDVQEVAEAVLESALEAAFDGSTTGEFKALLHVIIKRRIADYHRRKEGRPDTVSLPDPGDEDNWGAEPSVEFEGEALGAQEIVDIAMAELNDVHREAVELNVFQDLPAGGVADRLDLSEANVHQIKARFKKRVRELLDDGDTPGTP